MRPKVLAESVAQVIAGTVGPLQQRVKALEDAAATASRIAALEATVVALSDRLLDIEATRAAEKDRV